MSHSKEVVRLGLQACPEPSPAWLSPHLLGSLFLGSEGAESPAQAGGAVTDGAAGS